MTGKTEKIIIGKDGVARGIHGPLVAAVTQKLGDVKIMRASHVEPGSELSQKALGFLRAKYLDLDKSCKAPGDPPVFYIHPAYAAKWFADMTPVTPPTVGVILGPFDDRETALREEVKWLEAHNIPVCHPCRNATTA